MSIDPNETHDDEILVATFASQLEQVTDADQVIAAMRAPRIPTGGRHEARVKDTLETATTVRDQVRRWAPAFLGTVVFLTLLFSPAPMTGPLIVWVFGLVVFGIWATLGRPGVRDTFALAARRVAAVWGWLSTAWSMLARLLHRTEPEQGADQRPATA